MTQQSGPSPCDAGALHITLDELRARAPLWKATWVAVGNFDGVHTGHQRILRRAVAEAGGDAVAVALTFHPHPQAVVGSGPPPALTSVADRCAQIRALGIQCAVCLRFDRAVASLTPEEFVGQVLVDGFAARGVVVGYNFRFGHRAQGTPAQLQALGQVHGFLVRVEDAVRLDGEVVSSSLVRRRLREGDVEQAARLLGRPFRLAGRVVAGEGRGRELGFPTANVAPEPGMLLPGQGVYRVRLRAGDGPGLPAVASISSRPTFAGNDVALEVHVLDFAGDLYGQRVEVEFLDRLRGIVRFSSAQELCRQIERDVAEARTRFARAPVAPAAPPPAQSG
ncbi:MAG TPA: bifunctional riboflavin kinase/FAD synthetase [Limnochordales bacterium]|nr:bifunctional riboflavin kinase/FAD synthetase [Limnochordales bacterium]